ncbi:hypothetical protein C6Y14_17995 [Streptomyces dioscori]|uniref:Uncharacterized protein n=1 Tax=Streptomyces dioscori TaxID=2109333 RepID=A0A2P8Q7R1_9ACTN|nr:hypothetical protein C6Y14_17995 [Streptomyces dioscori]
MRTPLAVVTGEGRRSDWPRGAQASSFVGSDDPAVKDPVSKDPVVTDLVVTDLVVTDLVVTDLVVTGT